MTARGKQRQLLVWSALALTLAATAWVAASDRDDEGTVAMVKPARIVAPSSVTTSTPAAELAYQPRTRIEGDPEELFPGDAPPGEAAAAPAPPPRPTTPPLPFSYAGKLVEEGNFIVFLSHGQRNFAVHAGDVIDGVWRVESIRPPTMILAYLPLKTEVPLAIGETN